MQKVVKVKFRNSGRFYYFDAGDFKIEAGDGVIVDTARGNMLGEAMSAPEETPEEKLVAPLKPVLRLATDDDFDQLEYYRSKEPEAQAICEQKIAEHGLGMKLVDVEYAYNGTKLTFYFTADARVDFRELLKDLTSIFKTRIDLRQIGERDEAKKCGGLGFCGRPICCSTFLSEFTPVSIKMAKTQNLSLNPIKISGVCGKLMCCLRYEQESYESMQKIMPKAGNEIMTPDGVGTVLENNIISETTKVKVTLSDGTLDVRSYPFRDLEPVGCGGCSCPADTGSDQEGDDAAADGGETPIASEKPAEAPEAPDAPDAEPKTEKQQPRERKLGEQGPAQANQDADNGNQQRRPPFKNNRQHQRQRNPQRNFVPKQDNGKPKQVY